MSPPSLSLRSPSRAATRDIAEAVAATLQPGDLLALTGELGAGKTSLVQGLAAAMSVREPVRSPSFLLRRDYVGRLPSDPAVDVGLTHIDVYRVNTLHEVLELGIDEPDAARRVTVVEWGDAVRPLLGDHLEVELTLPDLDGPALNGSAPGGDDPNPGGDGDEPRALVLRLHGPAWCSRMDALRAATSPWSAP